MSKRCGRCGQIKCLEQFHRRGGGHQTWCKACRRTYDAQYHRATRVLRAEQKKRLHADFKRWYIRQKQGVPCADCGQVFHPAAMQWDHPPAAVKSANIADLARKHCRRRVLAEIAKCEIVCANCHAVRTFLRRSGA